MKGSIGFGAPKQQRLSIQYGYSSSPPSFWQEVKTNAHLIIAAVGTAALLALAGVALWLAMPPGDRQAFAAVKQPVSRTVAAAVPAAQPSTGQQIDAAMAPQLDSNGFPVPRMVKTTKILADGSLGEAAPKGDAVTAKPVAAEASASALPTTDPRWTVAGVQTDAPQNPVATQPDQAATDQQDAQVASAAPADAAAFAEPAPAVAPIPAQQTPPELQDQAKPEGDGAQQTAAIPAVKPQKPAASRASGNGHILRDVTMRSGPKKGASQVGTIPAHAAVQVITCKQWCQVVYKGKTGWIYKGFLGRN